MIRKIPVAEPDLSDLEIKYATRAIESTWISSSGEFLERFESEFSRRCESKHCLAVSNGTVALHLALLTLDVRPGDEVIVPSLTYIATANAVRYVGAEPVFVDVDPETWCISPERIEDAITRRTKGIIAVHLYGHAADMDRINQIAGVNGLWVVEDAAEAPFGKYKGTPTGALGTIATFSFYGNKVITSGEGGALTLNDDRLALRAKTLRGQGMDPSRRYYFPVTGYNFRLTNLAAALLCAQLDRIEEILAWRSEIYARYNHLLENCSHLNLQRTSDDVEISPWLYCVLVGNGRDGLRDRAMNALSMLGIETRPFFIPLHTLPPFREQANFRGDDLPVTEDLAARGINLPTCKSLTNDIIQEIAVVLRSV